MSPDTPRPAVETRCARDHVTVDVILAMVVPTRGGTGRDDRADQLEALSFEGQMALDSWAAKGLREI